MLAQANNAPPPLIDPTFGKNKGFFQAFVRLAGIAQHCYRNGLLLLFLAKNLFAFFRKKMYFLSCEKFICFLAQKYISVASLL